MAPRNRRQATFGALLCLGMAACSQGGSSSPPRPSGPSGSLTVAVCPGPPATHLPVANPPRHFDAEPKLSLDSKKGLCAYIATPNGVISVRLRPDAAPHAVSSFVFLARKGFYDGLSFDHVCPQPDDPVCPPGAAIVVSADPAPGGAGYTLAPETPHGEDIYGTVGLDVDGSRISGSRFFISKGDNRALPRRYPLIGQVTDGLLAAAALAKGAPILWVDVETTPLS